MYSDEIIRGMNKDLKNVKSLLNLSDEKLNYILYKMPLNEFSLLIEEYHKETISRILKAREKDKDFLYSILDSVVCLDVYRSYINSTHFLLSDNVFKGTPDYTYLSKVGQEDLLFDFNSKEYLVRISKCRYKMQLGGEYYPVYKVTLSLNPELLGKKDSNYYATVEFDFVIEKLPRLFVYGEYKGVCEECKKCKSSQHKIQNFNGFIHDSGEQILCGKKVREYNDCVLNSIAIVATGHSIDELLNACVYAVGLYVDRSKRKTEKSEVSGVLIKRKTHEPSKNSKSESRMVTLREYNSLERKEKREWQGGHHNSPVQHERSGHWRLLKNGKRVWVKSCTVNKDKDKGIYKV